MKDKPDLKRQPSKHSNQSSNSVGQRKSSFTKPEGKPVTGLADWATVTTTGSRNAEQKEVDPFLCKCKACRYFWIDHFGAENAELLASSIANRSRSTGPMFYVKHLEVKVGDRVLVWRKFQGIVKFIGPLADDLVSPHLYIGVRLDDNIKTDCDGIYKGKRYFRCTPGHGAFVKYKDILVIPPPDKERGLTGHEMFPSHRKIVSERREKRELLPDYDLGITEREKRARAPSLSQALHTSRKVPNDRVIYDPLDVAYQDYVRCVNRPPPAPRTKVELTDREKRDIELRKEFGGGKRAERLIKTVEKLRKAFKEGLEVEKDEDSYDTSQ